MIDDTGSGHLFMPLYIAQSGDLEGCNACLTDGQTLNDSATQLLTKYKSGALVTQLLTWGLCAILDYCLVRKVEHQRRTWDHKTFYRLFFDMFLIPLTLYTLKVE